jgi:hypothetical protein
LARTTIPSRIPASSFFPTPLTGGVSRLISFGASAKFYGSPLLLRQIYVEPPLTHCCSEVRRIGVRRVVTRATPAPACATRLSSFFREWWPYLITSCLLLSTRCLMGSPRSGSESGHHASASFRFVADHRHVFLHARAFLCMATLFSYKKPRAVNRKTIAPERFRFQEI